MTGTEKELRLLLREIYADAMEQVRKAQEDMERHSVKGRPDMVVEARMHLVERERAANRIRTLFIKHGFNFLETD